MNAMHWWLIISLVLMLAFATLFTLSMSAAAAREPDWNCHEKDFENQGEE